MPKDADNLLAGRVTLVTKRTIQSTFLLEVLSSKLPLNCTMTDDLDQAIRNALLGEQQSLVIVDATLYEPPELIHSLSGLRDTPSNSTVTALVNVERAATWPSKVVPLGLRALFTTEDTVNTVLRGLQAVLDGDVWLPRKLLLNAAINEADGGYHEVEASNGQKQLTPREREILSLVCTGASNDQVAERLNISSHTVKTHLYNIYKKIGAPNRMQAVLWGAKHL